MLDLTCFGDNYIGVLGCSSEDPDSGLWFHQLSGMTLKKASSAAKAEQVTGRELLRDIEKEAIRYVITDIQTKMSDLYAFNSVLSEDVVGYFSDTHLPVIAGSPYLIFTNNKKTDKLRAFTIEKVTVRANNTITGQTITLTDGCSTIVKTFDTEACGTVDVYFNHTTTSSEVTIEIDGTTGIELNSSSLTKIDSHGSGCGCTIGCDTCNSCDCLNGCFSVSGYDENDVSTGLTYGMEVTVSCECNLTAFACALRNDIAQAVRLKMGILTLYEVTASDRLNPIVLNSGKSVKFLLTKWEGGYDDITEKEIPGEYTKEISRISKSIRQWIGGSKSACVVCQALKVIPTIP